MALDLDDALFRPRAIAVIGASNDPAKLSGRPLDYLLRLGYKGPIYPVNSTRDVVQGVKAYDAITSVPGLVDLAVVVVPAAAVPKVLAECAAAGVSAAIVFASGFSEMVGEKGQRLQAEITKICRETGLRVLGPNCLGSFSTPTAAFATFSSAFDELGAPPDDPIGLVSQSGAVGTFMLTSMMELGIGVRHFANTGNEADISAPELLSKLVDSSEIHLVLGYLEDWRDAATLADAAKNASALDKPLLLLKSGITPAGARAVGLHTASQPGQESEFVAVIEQHGAVRVDSMESAVDAIMLFRNGRRAGGRRLTLITSSGGAASLATDAAIRAGLQVNEWSAEARKDMAGILPEFGSTANPIDLTGAVLNDPELLDRALTKIIAHADTDMILVVIGNADRGSEAIVRGIAKCYHATKKPFAVSWTGGTGRPKRALLAQQVPTYTEPARAVAALNRVASFSLRLQKNV